MSETLAAAALLCVYASLLAELVFFPVPSVASTRQLLSRTSPQCSCSSLLCSVQRMPPLKKALVLLIPAAAGISAFFIPLLHVLIPPASAYLIRIGFLEHPLVRTIGIVLMAGGRGITISGVYSFRKNVLTARTAPLATQGIYSWTRNPIALGLVVTFLGFSLAFPSLLIFLGFLIFTGNMHFRILMEEDHLKHSSPGVYHRYLSRTRRYL